MLAPHIGSPLPCALRKALVRWERLQAPCVGYLTALLFAGFHLPYLSCNSNRGYNLFKVLSHVPFIEVTPLASCHSRNWTQKCSLCISGITKSLHHIIYASWLRTTAACQSMLWNSGGLEYPLSEVYTILWELLRGQYLPPSFLFILNQWDYWWCLLSKKKPRSPFIIKKSLVFSWISISWSKDFLLQTVFRILYAYLAIIGFCHGFGLDCIESALPCVCIPPRPLYCSTRTS